MTNSPVLDVGIFDDFEDAEKMPSTVCQQVSMKEYEEDISSETDKALGDLCFYLDQHPEVYARILRKRKQENLENSGIVSFVKSKMMKLVHAEDYPECLVSLSECMQQTSSLKAGMCKTFQYSQEVKGTPNRYSKRLAAKRNTFVKRQMEKTDLKSSSYTSCVNADSRDSQTECSNSRENSVTLLIANDTETRSNVSVNASAKPSSCLSRSDVASVSNSTSQGEMEGSPHGQNSPNEWTSKEKEPQTKEGPISPEGLRKYDSKACPLPPTPPIVPPLLTIPAQSPWNAPRKTLSALALNVESRNNLSQRRSPRVGKSGDGGKIASASNEG